MTKLTEQEKKTLSLLKKYEGFRDTVYLDGKGIPTIGYGFTDPVLIKKGTISLTDADARLLKEVRNRLKQLRDTLGADKWDSLSDDSKAALTSYHYNYPAGFKDTTKFMNAWNTGNYQEAIRQVDAGMNDRKNPGLRPRRLEEQKLLKNDPFLNQKTVSPLNKYTFENPQYEPAWVPEQPIKTIYPLNNTTPKSISSWSGADAPNATPRLKDLLEVRQEDLNRGIDVYGDPISPFSLRLRLPLIPSLFSELKDGKLPKYEDGTSVLRDVLQEYKKYDVDDNIYYDKIKKDWDNLIQWADNWLLNRAQLFADNIDTYSGQPYRGSSADAVHVAPIPILDLWDRYRFYNARKIAKEQINHAKLVPVYDLRIDGLYLKAVDRSYAIDDFLKMKYGTQGAYYPPTYKNKFKDEEIFIAPNETMWDISTPLHEFIHAATSNYQILLSEIDKIFGGYSKDTGRKYNDKYLDDSNEVYSRLMQFRYDNKLNPNKKVSKQDLNHWRSKHINGRDLLNRYPDDVLLKLFNNVANNTTKNNGLLFAQDGKLPGYVDGKSPIHIKPANRGKLTRLKKRTGKSESELYNDGNPAHRKMVVFARNARKWKH